METVEEAFDALTAMLPTGSCVHCGVSHWIHNVSADGPGPCRRGATWSIAIRQESIGCFDRRPMTGTDLEGVVARALARWRRRAERAERLGVPSRVLLDSGDVVRVVMRSGRLFVRTGGRTFEAAYVPDPAGRRITIAGVVPRERRRALLEHAVRELESELGRRKAAA